jgi:hypothetical protein
LVGYVEMVLVLLVFLGLGLAAVKNAGKKFSAKQAKLRVSDD